MSRVAVVWISLLAAGALLLVSAFPAAGISETWIDEFNDSSLLVSHSGVVVSGGRIRLGLPLPERQGLQLRASDTLLSPSIVRFGSTFYMYYTLTTGSSGVIELATSTDLNSWTLQGVVISPGFAGSTDAGVVAYEDVLIVGSTWHMWYAGSGSGAYAIHHATSANGTAWSPDGVVISASSEGVSGFVYFPSVLWDGAKFTMWFTNDVSGYTSIRKATSTDGHSWSSEGAVLTAVPDGIENAGPRMPDVVRDGSDYVMWYTCVGISVGQICRARSPDGTNWTREGVAIPPDSRYPGEEIGVAQGEAMLLSPGTYRIWYEGRGSGGPDAIYSALLGGRYGTSGSVVSVSIGLPANFTWLAVALNRTTPAGTSIKLTVRDAATGLPIAEYTNVSSATLSLIDIDAQSVPRIALQAWLSGAGADTPILDSWSVTFGTLPAGPPSFWDQYQVFVVVGLLGAAGAGLGVLAYLVARPGRRPPAG